MALLKPSPGLPPADNYLRFGRAFDAIDQAAAGLVDLANGKQDKFDLAGLLQCILRINAGLYPALRPGDNPSAFSGSFDKGNPDDLGPLSEADYPLQVVDDGLGRDLFATRDIWERALHPVGGGELWRARWNYRRRANSSDPSNDSVQRFVFWYGPDRNPLSATEVGSEAPSIASGPRAFSQIIGSNLAVEGALRPPSGAAYFRIGIRAYGLEQRTTVTDLGAVEITDALQLLLNLIPPDSVPALAKALSDEIRARQDAVSEEARVRKGDDDALREALAPLLALFQISPLDGFTFLDDLGFPAAVINRDGLTTSAIEVSSALRIEPLPASVGVGGLVFADELGFVGKFRISSSGEPVFSGGQGSDAAEIAARSNRALALTAEYRQGLNTSTAVFGWAYNHILVYGQSLATGMECWPAKTLLGMADVLMLGQSVRPNGGSTVTTPQPLGDAVLRTAVATVQNENTGALYSPAQVAALPAGDFALGEEPGLAGAIFARQLYLQHRGRNADPERKFVVSNLSVPGKTVEQLSKGASPELFNRMPVYAQAVKAAATAANGDYGVPAVLYLQGEYNYRPDYGGATDKATFKARTLKLFQDISASVAAISGQTAPPAFITYQSGGAFTSDASDLSIGQAQLEMAEENTGIFLAAPSYPVNDKGGHLTANGSRWLGCQMDKVLHEVVTLRRRWRPLSPIQVTARGKTILADFHVPCPPLQWQGGHVDDRANNNAPVFANKGFTVIDAVGVVPIISVEIVADAVVAINLGRSLKGPAFLYYARSAEYDGHGNLCDSDPTVAPFNYEYSAGSGDYPAANIASLVGKPYPLWNWCVAFKRAITPA